MHALQLCVPTGAVRPARTTPILTRARVCVGAVPVCQGTYHKKCAASEGPNCGMAHLERALEDALAASAPARLGPSPATTRHMKKIGGAPCARSWGGGALGCSADIIGPDDVFGKPLVALTSEDAAMPAIAVMCMQAIEQRGAWPTRRTAQGAPHPATPRCQAWTARASTAFRVCAAMSSVCGCISPLAGQAPLCVHVREPRAPSA
jgi:hypothetical protein